MLKAVAASVLVADGTSIAVVYDTALPLSSANTIAAASLQYRCSSGLLQLCLC